MRTIDWVGGAVEIIDQTALPDELRMVRLSTASTRSSTVDSRTIRSSSGSAVWSMTSTAPPTQSMVRTWLRYRPRVDSAA